MWLRRLAPQKVRVRLTLMYAGLFLLAGSALLGITYGLVAVTLPDRVPGARTHHPTLDYKQLFRLEILCHKPHPDPATVLACKQEFTAGENAGVADTRQAALDHLLLYSLVGLGVMTVASGGLGWFMSGRVLRPVRTITEAARRASDEHLGERLAMTGPRDELRELADTFDDMLDRLDRAFGAQRRFVANASHELRTPLTVMRTAIDVTLAKPGCTAQQLADMAVRVRRSVGRAETMIDALLTLAISDQAEGGSEFVDLSTLAEDALDVASASVGRLGLRVDSVLEPAETAGDPQLLERLVWNLVDNAVRHNEAGGWVRLRTGTNGTTAFLQVANSGPVVPAEAVPVLTEPFRRAGGRSGSHDGAGLGLSIAQSVAAAHEATLEVRSQPEGGLDVRFSLPWQTGAAKPGRESLTPRTCDVRGVRRRQ
ncbi:MAG TPA: HAMP domain-containing sensor histidine kinase [Streptosporangiaceae bacterium]|nr:HAMP domain-containing sensor histidine kinase [Streptosporangiaceae bacterium]